MYMVLPNVGGYTKVHDTTNHFCSGTMPDKHFYINNNT